LRKTLTIRVFFQLIRLKVSLAVAFSGLAAGIICSGHLSPGMLIPFFGIFFLAAGASALNQYQEGTFDSRMERTKNRPLPSGLLSPRKGLLWSLGLLMAGIIVLMFLGQWICLVLGVFNILWYNGLYTWLKRKTAFAVVPGAFTGAIPVFMGWSAAGGNIFDRIPVFIAVFIFLWQIPHFWLLMLKYGDEYRNAGYPVLSDLFRLSQMKRIILFWLLAASVSSLLLISVFDTKSVIIAVSVLFLNILLLFIVFFQLFISHSIRYRILFLSVNLFMMIVLLMLTFGRIIS
jgi:heme o synthase